MIISMMQSCVTTYQPLQVELLPSDDYVNVIGDSAIHIALDYDVLTGPSSKQYARMERRNMVSLVVLDIQNSGNNELFIPEDLVFRTRDGYSIQPFSMEEGTSYLVEPVTEEDNEDLVDVEVDVPLAWDLLWGAGKLSNDVKRVVSHVRFMEDMKEHYLENRILGPGMSAKGFLILPVRKGTPLEISLW